MSNNQYIHIQKANLHNLKNVSIKIPKNTLSVITGPSGSGKSSLIFDTIHVEAQRRYIESLSSYARQFLGQYQPPDVESIKGLSPSIAIDQNKNSRNPRSTVGTITEVYDYFRILFSRVGDLYDPKTNDLTQKYNPIQIVKKIQSHKEKTKIIILSPIFQNKKISFEEDLTPYLTMGFSRFRVNNEIIILESKKDLKKGLSHNIDLVVDRIILKKNNDGRLLESIESALKIGNGHSIALIDDEEYYFSENNINPKTGEVFPDLSPKLFSFNSPIGACPTCNGLGERKEFNIDLMIGDSDCSIFDGGIKPLKGNYRFLIKMIKSLLASENISIDTPLKKIPKKVYKTLFYGSSKIYTYSFTSDRSHFEFSKAFPGICKWLEKKMNETHSEKIIKKLEEFLSIQTCSSCNGMRLNPIALNTLVDKKNIAHLSVISIEDALSWTSQLSLEGEKALISKKLIKEIKNRLQFLVDVGLGYLSLNRSASSLSGGESQRIRLATQIGSSLSGVLYILDEPSIGLHQRDNIKLIKTLKTLRDLGNTILVIEHDEETMLHSDFLIDMGAGAGIHGGNVIASGPIETFLKNKNSITAQYLNKKETIFIPKQRRTSNKYIIIKKAHHHNLKDVNVSIPLERLVCFTGVSGSGKSTLLREVLVPACHLHLKKSSQSILYKRNNFNSISGLEYINDIIELSQSPIGKTPHSNPATYTALFGDIRNLFAELKDSKIRGHKPGRFSFNIKGGRCDTCEGNGIKKIEMHFLPDVYITCDDCNGTRYNKETLAIYYKNKNIADVLNMTIQEAFLFFKNHSRINRILSTLIQVGLGYLTLGQSSTTLSGGEAQRLKLARELSKKAKDKCLYVLDEPTTGLHFKDIKVLLRAINDLLDKGHSVIIIEHNLDVIKSADWVIDLGPEGGNKGGSVIAKGTPEDIIRNKKSWTGKYLKKYIKK